MYESVNLECPVFACSETHDTPRIASREGGMNIAKMTTLLNMFMPNGVPFINSGQEVYEIQPMNTGIDCTKEELYRLPQQDPYNEKLALFDKYAIHYLNDKRWDIINDLEKVSKIRSNWINQIVYKKIITLFLSKLKLIR